MPLPVKFRAYAKNSTQWVYGFYAYKQMMNKHFILQEEVKPYCVETVLTEIEINPDTLGQLRHMNQYGEYYDGDVYYHAGYGLKLVSSRCKLQSALDFLNAVDIGNISGNIHDTPDILNQPPS